MALNTPLRKWIPVISNMWHRCYKSDTLVYWGGQDEEVLHEIRESSTSGFYHYYANITEDPLDSHPIKHQQIGESILTQKKYHKTTL